MKKALKTTRTNGTSLLKIEKDQTKKKKKRRGKRKKNGTVMAKQPP